MNDQPTTPLRDEELFPQVIKLTGHKGTSGVSLKIMACITGALLLLGIFSWFQSQGHTLVIQSNVVGATVLLDGGVSQATTLPNGVTLQHLPTGIRHVTLYKGPDYAPLAKDVEIGWFSKGILDAEMTPIPVAVTISTEPRASGAEVFLDEVKVGMTDKDGVFFKREVLPKAYRIIVRMKDRKDFQQTVELHPPAYRQTAFLQLTDEAIRQADANRAETSRQVAQARQFIAAKNYEAALNALNRALALDPQHSEAQTLRTQVEELVKILGGK